METVEVYNLRPEDLRAWVSDVLEPAAADANQVAELVHGRTQGNPFYARGLLSYLYDSGFLLFDPDAGRWRCDVGPGAEGNLPGDVVDLFRKRLLQLGPDIRDVFARAACLGSRFDIASLAVITRRPPEACRMICMAHPEIVMKADDRADVDSDEQFRFVHDRIQQAAHTLIPAEALAAVHLEIGQLLLGDLKADRLHERLFEVADHINAGHDLIRSTDERHAVQVNVSAARRAWAATAYRSALRFHRAAARFLTHRDFSDHQWADQHALALEFFQEWAQSEFLEGNRTEAERCIREAVEHARSPREKAETLNISIVHNTLLARYPEAIAAGREALSALGIALPHEEYEAESGSEMRLLRQSIEEPPIQSLTGLPTMSDPLVMLGAKILITMGPPCYRSHQRLWGVIVPKVVNLTLRYGNIPQIGYSHPAIAGLLCWTSGDYHLAHEFGKVAARLMSEKFCSSSDRSVYYLMMGSSTRHWFEHLSKASEDFANACEMGLQSGNLQYSAYAFGHNMYCGFFQGRPLADLVAETEKSLEFSRTRLNQWAIDLLSGGLRILSSLSAEEPDTADRMFSSGEGSYLAQVEEHRNIQVTCIYKVLKSFYLLLLDRHEEAVDASDAVEPILYTVGMQGLLPWPEHEFTRCLAIVALSPNLRDVRRCQGEIEMSCPERNRSVRF